MLIDDFSDVNLVSTIGTRWRGVSDQVMGGISKASVAYGRVDGRSCLRLTGDVRLEHNGGFIEAALDLAPPDGTLDASAYAGLYLVVLGNGEQYAVHLRTADTGPRQSYRAPFGAGADWTNTRLPFDQFMPHRLELPLDVATLRRLGVFAIGRAFRADLAIAEIGFYR